MIHEESNKKPCLIVNFVDMLPMFISYSQDMLQTKMFDYQICKVDKDW